MIKSISDNKHEFNVRRVEEINEAILEKEAELKNIEGFVKTIKVKLELRRLYKQINIHGTEVLRYEHDKANNIN